MATRSQVEYFHNEACPGGFLPPFDSNHWKGDSLQRHSVEFWSGGFQLFGQCYFNRCVRMRILLSTLKFNSTHSLARNTDSSILKEYFH